MALNIHRGACLVKDYLIMTVRFPYITWSPTVLYALGADTTTLISARRGQKRGHTGPWVLYALGASVGVRLRPGGVADDARY